MRDEIHPREQRLLEKQRIDGALTEARTHLAKLRCERDAMVIAMRKGELIKRYDAKLQLSFGLTTLRQRLMSFAHALPPRLVGRTEHEIGQILDGEMRSALSDIVNWPGRLGQPDWDAEIDKALRPPEAVGNGAGEDAATKRERANEKRRAKYAKSKEG
jgi:hypothetical protein